MSKYITVSTKVKKDLKKEAEKLGINISEVLSSTLEKIDIDRIIESIREDREGK